MMKRQFISSGKSINLSGQQLTKTSSNGAFAIMFPAVVARNIQVTVTFMCRVTASGDSSNDLLYSSYLNGVQQSSAAATFTLRHSQGATTTKTYTFNHGKAIDTIFFSTSPVYINVASVTINFIDVDMA